MNFLWIIIKVKKIWVNKNLVEKDKDGYIISPNKCGKIVDTGKNFVIKPGNNHIFVVYIEEGYRGYSEITKIEGGKKIVEEHVYASQRGVLGIGECSLIEANKIPVKIHWKRDGRLYGGANEGILIIEKERCYNRGFDEPDEEVEELLKN